MRLPRRVVCVFVCLLPQLVLAQTNNQPATNNQPVTSNQAATNDSRLQAYPILKKQFTSITPSSPGAPSGTLSIQSVQAQSATGTCEDEETKDKQYCRDLRWDSGGVDQGPISTTHSYKLIVHGLNDVLYDYDFTYTAATATDATFNDLMDLVQSISTSNFGGGSSSQPKQSSKISLDFISKSNSCSRDITDTQNAFSLLNQASQAINPNPTGSDKPRSISLQTTLDQWPRILTAYNNLQGPVEALRTDATSGCLNDSSNSDSDSVGGVATLLTQVEQVEGYVRQMADAVAGAHTKTLQRYFSRHDTNVATATESYKDKQTDHAPVTFKLNDGLPWSTLSAGFLLTELPNPSYSSRTAPNGSTGTQNVLAVDYGSGVRPALVGLFNAHVPCEFLDRPDWGVAISAGPVYDITGGKADTSKVGFFGGLTWQWHRLVYFTGGVHVGEYGAFPIGFTHAGQVIPPNTGTPQATKRYTARAAFAITFSWSKKSTDSNGSQPKQQSPAPTTTKPPNNGGSKNGGGNPPSK